jgi:hypothetical protein
LCRNAFIWRVSWSIISFTFRLRLINNSPHSWLISGMFPLNWKLEGDGNFDFDMEKPNRDTIICYYGNLFSLSNHVEKFVLLTR